MNTGHNCSGAMSIDSALDCSSGLDNTMVLTTNRPSASAHSSLLLPLENSFFLKDVPQAVRGEG